MDRNKGTRKKSINVELQRKKKAKPFSEGEDTPNSLQRTPYRHGTKSQNIGGKGKLVGGEKEKQHFPPREREKEFHTRPLNSQSGFKRGKVKLLPL